MRTTCQVQGFPGHGRESFLHMRSSEKEVNCPRLTLSESFGRWNTLVDTQFMSGSLVGNKPSGTIEPSSFSTGETKEGGADLVDQKSLPVYVGHLPPFAIRFMFLSCAVCHSMWRDLLLGDTCLVSVSPFCLFILLRHRS